MESQNQTGTTEQAPKPAPLHAFINGSLKKIGIFQVSDLPEFYAATDIESALKEFQNASDYTDSDMEIFREDAFEVVDRFLDELYIHDDGEKKATFREAIQQMIDDGSEFPCMFAAAD